MWRGVAADTHRAAGGEEADGIAGVCQRVWVRAGGGFAVDGGGAVGIADYLLLGFRVILPVMRIRTRQASSTDGPTLQHIEHSCRVAFTYLPFEMRDPGLIRPRN